MYREESQHLGRGTNEGWLTAATHANDFVAEFRYICQGVGDHNDGHPVIGQATQQSHDLPIRAFVQPTGDLVEEK